LGLGVSFGRGLVRYGRALRALIVTVGALTLVPVPAASEEFDEHEITTMVRASVAEADWNPVDRAANWHSQARTARSKGITLREQLEAYCSAFEVEPTPRLRWVLALERSCTEPPSWPDNLRWSRWEPKCHRAFADAEAFLRGELRDPCPGATLFGSPNLPTDVANIKQWLASGKVIPAICQKGTSNLYFKRVNRR
jgi:hypothetical protein